MDFLFFFHEFFGYPTDKRLNETMGIVPHNIRKH